MDRSDEVSPRLTIIAFIIVIVMIVIGAVLLYLGQPQPVEITINPPEPTATPEPTHTPEPILVYLTGEVNKPETTVILAYGSRVSDAIEAVGGLTENADIERVNLAAIAHDGDQIHVPAIGGDAVADVALPTPSGGELVYINSATLEEIQTLPGIGVSTAQAILDYRQENGNFSSLEDLDNVPGIGPSTLENIAALVSFE
jgi:competence protein ComEA